MAPPSALGALALVPLEIRQMIYALALSYSPSIAQTSKELREETRFALQKHGIYRMHSFFERAPPYGAIMTHIVTPHGRLQSPLCFLSPPLISSSTLPIVQNLQITIEVVKPYRGYGLRKDYIDYWKLIDEVVSTMRTRAHCHIIFVLDRSRDGFQRYQFEITASVRLLRDFGSVTIELRKQGQSHDRAPVMLGVGIHSDAAAVALFKANLGFDDEGRGSWRPKVQIITTFVDQQTAKEVLWDSQALQKQIDGDHD